MNIKLLAEHHFEFLSLKGGWTGSSESTLVKMPYYWKSHVSTHIVLISYSGPSGILGSDRNQNKALLVLGV